MENRTHAACTKPSAQLGLFIKNKGTHTAKLLQSVRQHAVSAIPQELQFFTLRPRLRPNCRECHPQTTWISALDNASRSSTSKEVVSCRFQSQPLQMCQQKGFQELQVACVVVQDCDGQICLNRSNQDAAVACGIRDDLFWFDHSPDLAISLDGFGPPNQM